MAKNKIHEVVKYPDPVLAKPGMPITVFDAKLKTLVDEMFELIRRLNREGTTILLVEQNVMQSLEIADVAHVMEHGALTLSGPAAALAKDSGLAKAYLGM